MFMALLYNHSFSSFDDTILFFVLGGDLEIGAMIATGQIAAVIFFTDPLSNHPHESDIVSLNRICCVHDVMFANNPSSAKSLLFALQFSEFGYSRLINCNEDSRDDENDDNDDTRKVKSSRRDSIIVQKYKRNQRELISKIVSEDDVF